MLHDSHHLNPQGGKTTSSHPSSPHDPLLSYDPSPPYDSSFSDDSPFSHEILSFHGPYIFDHASDHISIPACPQPHWSQVSVWVQQQSREYR